MLKIRLMRIGTRKRPFYRIVVVDERKKRTGSYLDLIGTYNPLTEPKEIKIDQDKVKEWTKKGAQLSDGFLRITGKAPQRPPRKAKREKTEAKPTEPAAKEPATVPATEQTAPAEVTEKPAEDPTPNEAPVEPVGEKPENP